MDHNNIYYYFADDVNVNIPDISDISDISDVVTEYMYMYISIYIVYIELKINKYKIL